MIIKFDSLHCLSLDLTFSRIIMKECSNAKKSTQSFVGAYVCCQPISQLQIMKYNIIKIGLFIHSKVLHTIAIINWLVSTMYIFSQSTTSNRIQQECIE